MSEGKVADIRMNYMEILPREVMWMIFDLLDFEDVENASLVCQRWNNIISSSEYEKRLVLKIDMYIKHGSQDSIKQRMAEVRKVIGKSTLCYRRLKWYAHFWGDDQEIQLVWNAIHPKITANLQSLELYGSNSSLAREFHLIADELPSMTGLRSLIVELSKGDNFPEKPIILRSNSVNYLKAATSFKIRMEMPKLQRYEGSLSSLHRPENLPSLPLTELKHLILSNYNSFGSDRISKTAVQSIFRRLTKVETIKWFDEVEYEIFDVFLDNCTSLRELTVRSIGTGRKGYYSKTRFDLTKLRNLSKLELGNMFVVSVELPESITKLKICLNWCNQQNMMHSIVGCKSLEELQAVFDVDHEKISLVNLLKTLSVLTRLEVLVFHGGSFEESSFLHMNAPLERVRQLRFVGCNLSTKRFLGIQEKFPNLKEPQFCNVTQN